MIGYKVGQELDTMDTARGNAYSRGISQAYGQVFARISEVLAGNRDVATVLDLCSQDFEEAVAAQTVRGLL